MAELKRLIYLLLFFILLTGCVTVGPDYVPPEQDFPASWHNGTEIQTDSATPVAGWWRQFENQELDALLEKTFAKNHDLKTAMARLREARARQVIAGSARLPELNAAAAATRRRSSENSGSGQISDSYSAGFDASWELDIFGGNRRAVEAARADLEAVAAGLDDVRISLAAEVVINYMEACVLQQRLELAEERLACRGELFDLAAARRQAGLTDDRALNEARADLENARVQVLELQTAGSEALSRLAILLGEYPGQTDLELSPTLPELPETMVIGIPAAVLARRPDVRAAERELAAQTARIGEATADLYPKLVLDGSVGLEALKFKNLGKVGARTYGFGPRLSWPIFNAGAIRQNIEVQDALGEQALIAYEKILISAVAEVENALEGYVAGRDELEALRQAETARRDSVSLQQVRGAAGLSARDELLDTRIALVAVSDQRLQADLGVVSAFVSLYKALGGGWTSMPTERSDG